MRSMLPAIVLMGLCVAAAAPAANFNVNGQHRTRAGAEMKGERVPLRFADGTPNAADAVQPRRD